MSYRKLGHTSDQRKAMLRDSATPLIVSERIETTETRAKEIRSVVKRLITLGREDDLASRRDATRALHNTEILNGDKTTQTALQKSFDETAERYAKRQGGYTHILKVDPRRSDDAELITIELVD